MDQKIIAFEQLMSAAVDKYLAAGGKLQSHSFGSVASGCACPLEVLLASVAKTSNYVLIDFGPELLFKTTNLSFSLSELWDFVRGYDNYGHFGEAEFHSLGQKFRSKYPPYNKQTTAGQL